MINNAEYIKYFKFFFENLPNTKKEKIKGMLINGQVCPTKINPDTALPEDNSKLDTMDFVLNCMLQHQKAIRLFQLSEYYEEYKYSMYYTYSESFQEALLENPCFYNETHTDFLNSPELIEKAQFKKNQNKLYLKFTFKLEKFYPNFMSYEYNKFTFICVFDLSNKNVEIRFNNLVSPFTTNSSYYLHFINLIVKFIKENLSINLISLDFSFLTLKANREVIKQTHPILSTSTQFDDSGSADLTSNDDNKRPYVDEIEELLKLKEEELGTNITQVERNTFNYIRREILSFLQTKEDEARYKKIVVRFSNPLDDSEKGYRTTFSYLNGNTNSHCIVHHELLDLKEGGRLDNVRKIVFELERQFNSQRTS